MRGTGINYDTGTLPDGTNTRELFDAGPVRTYAGAGARGGAGWTIIDESTDPPSLDGDYVRDEGEQVRYRGPV